MSDNAGSRDPIPRFQIEGEIDGSYIAIDQAGNLALLIPLSESRTPIERAAGDVVLSFEQLVHFDLPSRSFDSDAAVIRCLNAELEPTFRVLAGDVARVVAVSRGRPTPHEVSAALARWEELLRARRALSRDEETGLWGELWFLLQLPRADAGVRNWRGANAEMVDFVGGGIGVECKASRRRLQHFVSQEQIARPLGDVETFVASLWVDEDSSTGRTINELVSELSDRLVDCREFEEKLLGTGYSRSDSHRYRLCLRVLEPPLLFRIEDIPRVREADLGVTQLRFLASLDEDAALSGPLGLTTMMKLAE